MHLLIDDVQLWDGTESPAQPKISVEVRDGRIHWIGSASQWQGYRATVRVVDGRARTLIPGLMDCHVHYSSPGGPEWIARFTDSLPEISMRAIELAEASLRSGVTTARDVGAPQGVSIRLARAARAGEIHSPNIVPRGPGLLIEAPTFPSPVNLGKLTSYEMRSERRLRPGQT